MYLGLFRRRIALTQQLVQGFLTSFHSRASYSVKARKCLSCVAVYGPFLEIKGCFFELALLCTMKITKRGKTLELTEELTHDYINYII